MRNLFYEKVLVKFRSYNRYITFLYGGHVYKILKYLFDSSNIKRATLLIGLLKNQFLSKHILEIDQQT